MKKEARELSKDRWKKGALVEAMTFVGIRRPASWSSNSKGPAGGWSWQTARRCRWRFNERNYNKRQTGEWEMLEAMENGKVERGVDDGWRWRWTGGN